MGGSSSSTPEIPPEFRPFITSALSRMTQQQGANPIDSYNAPNPMDVEGLSPSQQLGMSYAAGNMQPNPTTGLAMQAAQRAAGMAGQGPTTGMYDPSGEMGLQDWADVMRRTMGQGGEMGGGLQPPTTLGQGPGGAHGDVGDTIGGIENAAPPGTGDNDAGGPPNAGLGPMGGGLGNGTGGSGSLQDALSGILHSFASQGGPQAPSAAAMTPGQSGSPLGLNESWAQRLGMSGADVVNHWDAQHPNAAPELFQGSSQGMGGIGGSHTFFTRDSQGNQVPLMEQNGLNGEAGHDFGRPTDPRAAAAYDRLNNRPHVGFGGSTNPPPTGATPQAAPAKKAK